MAVAPRTVNDGYEHVLAEAEKVGTALARINALENLIVCYRTGKQPSEALHRDLARTKTRMDEVFQGFHPSNNRDPKRRKN